jgi:hypothetical protein
MHGGADAVHLPCLMEILFDRLTTIVCDERSRSAGNRSPDDSDTLIMRRRDAGGAVADGGGFVRIDAADAFVAGTRPSATG